MLSAFLSGVYMMGLSIAGLIFLRLWKESAERLFCAFAIAFWLMALERIPLALFHQMKEPGSLVYLLRLAAFLLILEAIARKNRLARRGRAKMKSSDVP
jgi:hypothetical protein